MNKYIKDMPSDIYHADNTAISNSGLKHIARSPAHYKSYINNNVGSNKNRNLIIGTAVHARVFERDLFYDQYHLLVNVDNRVCKDYREAKKEFGEEFVLVKSEIAIIEGIAKALYADKYAKEYLTAPGSCEVSGFSTDPETGVKCKHRFDKLLSYGVGVDLKTTTDARPEAFSKSIFNYGYHQQAAFYSDQYEWITGFKLKNFVFIAVESEEPYGVRVYRLDNESMRAGRDSYRAALETYAKCLKTDNWPGYESVAVERISIPGWALRG